MTIRAGCILSVALLALASCGDNHRDGQWHMDNESLRRDLQLLQGKRIYFGHQSVGFDIMKGVRELAAAAPELSPVFVSADTVALPAGGWFADSRIGRNNYPGEKCSAFRETVSRLNRDSLDIAIMKFCYADIGPRTDPAEVFEAYARTVDSLKKAFPGTVFVHATIPYTVRTASWKLLAKKVLGREDRSLAGNLQRTRFNALIARKYGGDPLFDIARVESTYPDGRRESFTLGGETAFSLIGDYTYDGGHLNETGRRLAARELLRVLAAAGAR